MRECLNFLRTLCWRTTISQETPNLDVKGTAAALLVGSIGDKLHRHKLESYAFLQKTTTREIVSKII